MFADTEDADSEPERHKKRFKKLEEGSCKFSDTVGIIDWEGLNVEMFMANQKLLCAAEQMLCAHFPHLIHRMYHINLPLDFDKVLNALKGTVSPQTMKKSIFLESQATFQRRAEWMKLHGKPAAVRRSRIMRTSRNNRKRSSRLHKSSGMLKLKKIVISNCSRNVLGTTFSTKNS